MHLCFTLLFLGQVFVIFTQRNVLGANSDSRAVQLAAMITSAKAKAAENIAKGAEYSAAKVAKDDEVEQDEDEDSLIERNFNDCLKQFGTSMLKYDKQLSDCSVGLNDPKTAAAWKKEHCTNVLDTGFPKCYDRKFNKSFRKCFNKYPFTTDVIIESMKDKYAAICGVKTVEGFFNSKV